VTLDRLQRRALMADNLIEKIKRLQASIESDCLDIRERAALEAKIEDLTGYAAQLRAGEAVGRATSRGPKPQRIFKTEGSP